MHEALFDDHWLEGTGVTTLDFAKALIDEGFHPMTMYFPLVVHGAMLIEPTETESKASLDQFIAALRDLAMAAKRGDTARFLRRAAFRAAPPPRRDARGTQAGAALEEPVPRRRRRSQSPARVRHHDNSMVLASNKTKRPRDPFLPGPFRLSSYRLRGLRTEGSISRLAEVAEVIPCLATWPTPGQAK